MFSSLSITLIYLFSLYQQSLIHSITLHLGIAEQKVYLIISNKQVLEHLSVSNSWSQSCVRSMFCESLAFHIRSNFSTAVTSMDTWQISRLIGERDTINYI